MSTFEDDTPPSPITDDNEFDVQGDEAGIPHPVTTPAPPPAPPARGRPRGKRAGRPAGYGNPQQVAERQAIAAGTFTPQGAPIAISAEDRDVRIWWPNTLKEEFIDKGYQPSDCRLTIERVRDQRAIGEKPIMLHPAIAAEQVLGHANLSPGDALVDLVTQVYHPGRGQTSYKFRAINVAMGSKPVGKVGTLDLESYADIDARQRRMDQVVRSNDAQSLGRPYAPMFTGSPQRAPVAPMPAVAPAMPLAPVAAGSDPNAAWGAMMMDFTRRLMEETMVAAKENRQPVMPAMPAIPTPSAPVVSEEERIARIAAAASKATIDALVVAGVIKPGATSAATTTAAPPLDPVDAMWEELARQKKKKEAFGAWARENGFISKDEIPEPEVIETPAPVVVGAEKPEPREGQGMFGFMIEQFFANIAQNPKQVLDVLGKAMENPAIGGMIKDLLAKQGMLPSIQTSGAPSVNGAGGFIPSP
jgi:hypothetical protein